MPGTTHSLFAPINGPKTVTTPLLLEAGKEESLKPTTADQMTFLFKQLSESYDRYNRILNSNDFTTLLNIIRGIRG